MIHENPPSSYAMYLDSRAPTGGANAPRPTTVAEPQSSADFLADVFGSSPATDRRDGGDAIATVPTAPTPPPAPDHQPHQGDVSDIPRLRSIHVTAGYRDGISESKTKYVQEGFDEGFTLGAELGLRVGWVIGVLEAIVLSLHKPTYGLHDVAEKRQAARFAEAKQLLIDARADLKTESVFGSTFFDEKGVWRYEVPGVEGEITFREVAQAHPVVSQWAAAVDSLTSRWNIDLGTVLRTFDNGDETQDESG